MCKGVTNGICGFVFKAWYGDRRGLCGDLSAWQGLTVEKWSSHHRGVAPLFNLEGRDVRSCSHMHGCRQLK